MSNKKFWEMNLLPILERILKFCTIKRLCSIHSHQNHAETLFHLLLIMVLYEGLHVYKLLPGNTFLTDAKVDEIAK